MNNGIKFFNRDWNTRYCLTNLEEHFGLHASVIIPWICYERSFSEFYFSIWNQFVCNKCFSSLFSHHSRIYWILPEATKYVFPTYWSKNKWISEFCRTNPQELKCWSSFFVNYFLRYYVMMQHQPILKRVNGTHGLAHRPNQLLTDPYHCCVYKHRRQDERQPPQSSCPVPICT